MWAARYFAVRDRLAAVMAGVDGLARETGAGAGIGVRLDPERGPWAPLRVLVCGDVNVGKSSLLNAWLGVPLCPAGPLPMTGQVMWYRHGLRREERGLPDGVRECRRPLGVLRDWEVIDTPGTGTMDRAGRAALAARAREADMVLVVFGHSNPWEPATWEVVERLDPEVLERVLLVVQQCDRFDEAEVPVVLGHVRDLSSKRAGRELPVVAVSAAQALAARRGEPVDGRLWQASGVEALGGFLEQRVCGSARWLAAVRGWHGGVAAELRSVEERIDAQARSVEGEAAFLTWMEDAVNGDRERMTAALAGRLEGYDALVRRLRAWLQRRLGVMVSFTRVIVGDRTAGELDRVTVAWVAEVAREQATADAVRLVAESGGRWASLVPEVAERLGMVMRPFEEVEPVLQAKAARFVERFTAAAEEAAEDIRSGLVLAPDLRRRLSRLGWWFALALALVTAAGITGALREPWWPWILLAAAALVWAVACVFGWLGRRHLKRDLEEHLAHAEGALVERLRRDAVGGIRAYYADFARQLDPVRRRVARARFGMKPTLERAGGLYLELKAVEQEIRKLEEEAARPSGDGGGVSEIRPWQSNREVR